SPPGASDINTPASFSETGNCATVASFAQPPSQDLGVTAPSANRKDGRLAPASGAGVGPYGGCPSADASMLAVVAIRLPVAASNILRRVNSDMASLLISADGYFVLSLPDTHLRHRIIPC